jgi:hypothetical protein
VTALEALGRADYIASVASRADVDRRTVVKCLRGESPLSTIWIAVQHAAEAMGIKDVPPPAPRPPRPPRPCAACAEKAERIADLEIIVDGVRAERDAASARVAELEATKPADALPSEPVVHQVAEPARPATLDDVLPTRDRPRPAPRPREKCRVRVLMPGEELLPDGTVTTPEAAAG